MYSYDSATNIAAKRSSRGERSRWRHEGVDPDLLTSPEPIPRITPEAQANIAAVFGPMATEMTRVTVQVQPVKTSEQN